MQTKSMLLSLSVTVNSFAMLFFLKSFIIHMFGHENELYFDLKHFDGNWDDAEM